MSAVGWIEPVAFEASAQIAFILYVAFPLLWTVREVVMAIETNELVDSLNSVTSIPVVPSAREQSTTMPTLKTSVISWITIIWKVSAGA